MKRLSSQQWPPVIKVDEVFRPYVRWREKRLLLLTFNGLPLLIPYLGNKIKFLKLTRIFLGPLSSV